jgi:hypothetical protein
VGVVPGRGVPQKPAKRLGVVVFPKTGPVRQLIREWPRTKPEQEVAAVEAFANTLEAQTGRRLERISPMPESGHDVEAYEDGERIEIEVTELVTEAPGGNAVQVDEHGQKRYVLEDLRDLLLDRTKAKISRYPRAPACRTMLLVYSVDTAATEFPVHEVTEDGRTSLVVPEPLRVAREFLAAHGAGPFAEVWFVAPTAGTWGAISQVWPVEHQ